VPTAACGDAPAVSRRAGRTQGVGPRSNKGPRPEVRAIGPVEQRVDDVEAVDHRCDMENAQLRRLSITILIWSAEESLPQRLPDLLRRQCGHLPAGLPTTVIPSATGPAPFGSSQEHPSRRVSLGVLGAAGPEEPDGRDTQRSGDVERPAIRRDHHCSRLDDRHHLLEREQPRGVHNEPPELLGHPHTILAVPDQDRPKLEIKTCLDEKPDVVDRPALSLGTPEGVNDDVPISLAHTQAPQAF
jgi:hypothetical protein